MTSTRRLLLRASAVLLLGGLELISARSASAESGATPTICTRCVSIFVCNEVSVWDACAYNGCPSATEASCGELGSCAGSERILNCFQYDQ